MADNKIKRRVKNPESFRERAIKASTAESETHRRGFFKRLVSRILGSVFGPIGQFTRKLWEQTPLRLLSRPLRVVGKVIFPTYLRNSWQELKLVNWPSWRESRRLTFAVLIFAIVFGGVIALVDFGLDKVFRNILLK